MASEYLTLQRKWSRLHAAVRGAAAVIVTEPAHLASVQATVDRMLDLLSHRPSAESVDEIEYSLRRVALVVAKWRPSGRPVRGALYTPPAWASSVDREVQEALRLLQEIRTVDVDRAIVAVHQPEENMKVFVSHSSADQKTAAALVDLLRAALLLSAKDVRCTSVDGYKLPAGSNSDEQLRREVFEAKAFIAILSPASMQSIYVMFELGARWGAKAHLAPVMVAGFSPNALKAPLSALHAVSGTSEADLHQLVETLGDQLGVQTEKPAGYLRALQAFVEAAKEP